MILILNKSSKCKLEGQLSNQFFFAKKFYRRELVILNSKDSFGLEESNYQKQIEKTGKDFLDLILKISEKDIERIIHASSLDIQEFLKLMKKKIEYPKVELLLLALYGTEIVLSSNLPVPLKRTYLIFGVLAPKIASLGYLSKETLVCIKSCKNLSSTTPIIKLEKLRAIFLIATILGSGLNEVNDLIWPNPYKITVLRTFYKLFPSAFFVLSKLMIYLRKQSFIESVKLLTKNDKLLILGMMYCLGSSSVIGGFIALSNNLNTNPIPILLEMENSNNNQRSKTSRSTSKGSKTIIIDIFEKEKEVKTYLPAQKDNLAPSISPEIDKTCKDYFRENFNRPPVK